jgi:hypothetical protein
VKYCCEETYMTQREQFGALCRTRNERTGIIWLKSGIWKIRGIGEDLGIEDASFVYELRMSNMNY